MCQVQLSSFNSIWHMQDLVNIQDWEHTYVVKP